MHGRGAGVAVGIFYRGSCTLHVHDCNDMGDVDTFVRGWRVGGGGGGGGQSFVRMGWRWYVLCGTLQLWVVRACWYCFDVCCVVGGLCVRYKSWAQGLIRLLVHKGVVTYEAIQLGAEAQASTLGKGGVPSPPPPLPVHAQPWCRVCQPLDPPIQRQPPPSAPLSPPQPPSAILSHPQIHLVTPSHPVPQPPEPPHTSHAPCSHAVRLPRVKITERMATVLLYAPLGSAWSKDCSQGMGGSCVQGRASAGCTRRLVEVRPFLSWTTTFVV